MKRLNLFYVFITCYLMILSSGCSLNRKANSDNAVNAERKIEIVNHRGVNRLAPENTYASAKKAIESGAAYVEVDVRRSKDGVYYNIHDRSLDRTTNGFGLVSETESEVIDTLDAGSWFGHEFKGERVPRLFEYLQWIKGKAKVYFDMKDVKLEEFIPEIYKLGMEKDCFFWFSSWQTTKEFRQSYPDLALKVNASAVEALDSLKTLYDPQIIECSVDELTDEFIKACHKQGMKVMPYIPGYDMEALRIVIQKNVDMINLDIPDIFSNMLKNNGVYKGYRLIAHRGGIVEGKYNEYDPASIQAAIDQGYYMLEIDVRETKDGVLFVNHDGNFNRFFGDNRRANEMTWEEVSLLKSDRGDYRPLLFEEVASMCTGKVKFMMDIKAVPTPEFFKKLGEIMEKYDLLSSAYFIDYKAEKYFFGKAKFSFRVHDIPKMQERIANGEDIPCNYFLFENGNRLHSEAIKWCQQNYITVVPTVNIFQYRNENFMRGAKRDIEYFKECGVTEFQIDSDFDDWLPNKE